MAVRKVLLYLCRALTIGKPSIAATIAVGPLNTDTVTTATDVAGLRDQVLVDESGAIDIWRLHEEGASMAYWATKAGDVGGNKPECLCLNSGEGAGESHDACGRSETHFGESC